MNTDIPRILHQGQLVHLLPADGRGKADLTLTDRAARCVDVEECFVYVLTASGDQFCYHNGLRVEPAREHWPLTPEQVQHAVNNAPATTRAHLRGRFITAAQQAGVDYQADWKSLRINRAGARAVMLPDPFANEAAVVDNLIAQLTDEPERLMP